MAFCKVALGDSGSLCQLILHHFRAAVYVKLLFMLLDPVEGDLSVWPIRQLKSRLSLSEELPFVSCLFSEWHIALVHLITFQN